MYQITTPDYDRLRTWLALGDEPHGIEVRHMRWPQVGPFETLMLNALESATLAGQMLGVAPFEPTACMLRVGAASAMPLHLRPEVVDECLFALPLYGPPRLIENEVPEELVCARWHFPGVRFGRRMATQYGLPASRYVLDLSEPQEWAELLVEVVS